MECDQASSQQLEKFESKIKIEDAVSLESRAEAKPRRRSAASMAAQKLCERLHNMCGVDLTQVHGFGALATQNLLAEIGLQMDR
jgi:hypothetical protein